MQRLFIYSLTLSIISCTNINGNLDLNKIHLKQENPISIIELDATHSRAIYFPIYVGKIQKTIVLNSYTRINKSNLMTPSLRWPKADELKVTVVTTKQIYYPGHPIPPPPNPYNDPISANNELVELGYPIFIENLSLDSLIISIGDYLPIVLEKQNSNNEWDEIQDHLSFHSLEQTGFRYLAPKQIAISCIVIGIVKEHSKFRLKHDYNTSIYSNEFIVDIN